MGGDWAHLNEDMLEAIAKKIDSYASYIRFRAVCPTWRTLLPKKPKRLAPQAFPYLLLPLEETKAPTVRCLLNPLDSSIVDHIEIPEVAQLVGADNLTFRGFSKGWLIATEREGPSIYLINTFPNDDLEDQLRMLPPTYTFPDVVKYLPNKVGKEFVLRRGNYGLSRGLSYSDLFVFFIRKVVLSSSRMQPGCTAMAIYGEFSGLAYCRYGDRKWYNVEGEHSRHSFTDIVFYEDKFYALHIWGKVVVMVHCEMADSLIAVLVVEPPSVYVMEMHMYKRLYLVVVGSSLVMAGRDITFPFEDEDDFYLTLGFDLLKLNLDSNSNKGNWCRSKLRSIGNYVLFFGANESRSYPSHSLPGCQGDLIFFTDDFYQGHDEDVKRGGSDLGVFNLKDDSISRFDGYQHPQSLLPPPVWVIRDQCLGNVRNICRIG